MTLVVHLSDLHLRQGHQAQSLVFQKLVSALRSERERARSEDVSIVVTGDVFDSATDPAEALVDAFLTLHDQMRKALGNPFTIVLPGNHDRRRYGLFGPNREELFQTLHRAADPTRMHVLGQRTPFLAEVVPQQLHGLPLHVVAYDSSYLPSGFIGAGGMFRLQDLLEVHAQLPDDGHPLLLLVHHHLIPTPITDISHVEMAGIPRPIRWLVRTALPALVSNADREELTMTALGAGTALSALHTFGRAVLLLHGHKHVPTVRLLRGLEGTSGDVILASAGSAGRAESVDSTQPNPARLWPSFNVVEFSGQGVRIEALSFSPKRRARPTVRRTLAQAWRVGPKWELQPVSTGATEFAARVAVDRADYVLSPSLGSRERWDFSCRRVVVPKQGTALRRYMDFVHALPPLPSGPRQRPRAYRRIALSLEEPTLHDASEALCRTLAEAERHYGRGSAFEWVGLLCRHGAVSASLSLSGPTGEALRPFASVTDLTTGRERPARLEARDGSWTMTVDNCVPRTLLRIYWPLAR